MKMVTSKAQSKVMDKMYTRLRVSAAALDTSVNFFRSYFLAVSAGVLWEVLTAPITHIGKAAGMFVEMAANTTVSDYESGLTALLVKVCFGAHCSVPHCCYPGRRCCGHFLQPRLPASRCRKRPAVPRGTWFLHVHRWLLFRGGLGWQCSVHSLIFSAFFLGGACSMWTCHGATGFFRF